MPHDNDTSPTSSWYVSRREGADGKPDIYFQIARAPTSVEQNDLAVAVERTLAILKRLYHDDGDRPKLEECVNRLVGLAQVGLVGAHPSPAIATAALRSLEWDITERESGPVKNGYMRKLGAIAAILGLLSTAAYFICDRFPGLPFEQVYTYRTIFLVWTGCMAGAWASFASRRVVLSFADLVVLEEDRIEPLLRLIFAGVLTVILSLIFATGMADLTIGGFQASAIMSSGATAVLTGALAGLAEKTLPSAIMARADGVIGSVKPS